MADDTDQMFFRRQTNNDQGVKYLTPWREVVRSGNVNTFNQIASDSLALKAPINNPTFTGNVPVNGTLSGPQLNPYSSQTNFNTIKAPGLYHSDAGLSNAPSSSQDFRSN